MEAIATRLEAIAIRWRPHPIRLHGVIVWIEPYQAHYIVLDDHQVPMTCRTLGGTGGLAASHKIRSEGIKLFLVMVAYLIIYRYLA